MSLFQIGENVARLRVRHHRHMQHTLLALQVCREEALMVDSLSCMLVREYTVGGGVVAMHLIWNRSGDDWTIVRTISEGAEKNLTFDEAVAAAARFMTESITEKSP